MKIITKTYKVYEFDELPEDIKEQVLDKFRYINVENNWYFDDHIEKIAEEYGIRVDYRQMYFDLDRENYVAFDVDNKKGIYIEDYEKFFRKAGLRITKRIKKVIEDRDVYIYQDYRNGRVVIYVTFSEGWDIRDNEIEALDECLNEMLDKILQYLKDMFDHWTSNEAIRETIYQNGYMFLSDGTLFCE